MGFSESDLGCRKHPNQKQLPGVCSSCLRERLTKLATSDSSYSKPSSIVSDSSSLYSSPPYSSVSSSTRKPSATSRRRHGRNASEAVVIPVGFVLHSGGCIDTNSGLKKSLSVTCAPRDTGVNLNNSEIIDGNCKKKTGFWKKLIRSTSRKTKGVLMHSRTTKETYN
ncbi:hypothetical protein Nepgr_007767 [Nepenthes gracilis]|uniref:Uncharacterized protein n=1 Tax=Nepenthes gracilis TaxID=150966 RepID=A0AAD3S8D0_NEPGR|nr:hypothetical protein Nepgr_007767 [Nepenthes gracilis]